MSHNYRKIKYTTQGDYGSVREEYLYIDYNATSDFITIFDSFGRKLIQFDEFGDLDMGQALTIALNNFRDHRLIQIDYSEFKQNLDQ
jgi:hypothetical protein